MFHLTFHMMNHHHGCNNNEKDSYNFHLSKAWFVTCYDKCCMNNQIYILPVARLSDIKCSVFHVHHDVVCYFKIQYTEYRKNLFLILTILMGFYLSFMWIFFKITYKATYCLTFLCTHNHCISKMMQKCVIIKETIY